MTESDQPKEPTPREIAEGFRASLEDLVDVAAKLAPHCATVEEMIGMAELALKNDGQLRMLMSLVLTKKR